MRVFKVVVVVFSLLIFLSGCKRKSEPKPSITPAPQATTVATPTPEVRMYKEFIFVSELYKDNVSEEYGRVYAIAQAAQDGTLIGIDENAGADQVQELKRRLGNKKVGFSLYLEGPGGPTGDEGEYQADELLRIVRRAKKYGKEQITDPKVDGFLQAGEPSEKVEDYEGYTTGMLDHLPWMKEWNRDGWPDYFQKESLPVLRGKAPFLGGEPTVFAAVEIDNLYRHLEASGRDFESFLVDLEKRIRDESPDGNFDVRLVLKNLNYDDEDSGKVRGLLTYAQKHGTELFIGFHIAEAETEDFPGRTELENTLKPLGIRTVVSTDTNDYLASTFESLPLLLRDSRRLRELEISVAANDSD